MKKGVVSFCALLLACLYPVLFLYFNNIGEIYFGEIIPAILFQCVCGVLFFSFAFLRYRNIMLSAVFGYILILFVANYYFIEIIIRYIFNGLRYWHIVPVLLVIIVYAFEAVFKKVSEDNIFRVLIILNVLMGSLITINIIGAVPKMLMTQDKQKQSGEIIVKNEGKDLPNVYWLLYDEYSNFPVIEKYFGYSNSDFESFLLEKRFNISYNSYNESDYTHTILTNAVNLEYIVDDNTSIAQKDGLRKDAPFVKLMEANGYSVVGVGATGFFGIDSETEKKKKGGSSNIAGEGVTEIILKKTLFYPVIKSNANYRAGEVRAAFDYFSTTEGLVNASPKFIICYLESPHQPFVFDQDGGENDSIHFNDWRNGKYYLNQYIYITKQIKNQIESILSYDSDCIIILQSDHSARLLEDDEGNRIIETQDRRNPLNAIYYRGESYGEFYGYSTVNTLRLLVNQMFDMDLEILEVPNNAETLLAE